MLLMPKVNIDLLKIVNIFNNYFVNIDPAIDDKI